LKGAHGVEVSYEKRRADVEFDSNSVGEQETGNAIEAVGYRARKD
jgi:copper chaperone CopZ